MGQMLPFAVRDAPIAIIDDDSSVRDTLALLLKIEGFASQTFADGESFLENLQTVTPSCVILDMQLPGRSGLAILKQLADERFAPPVFVVSGHSDIATAVEAMKLGARDFLEKPFAASAMIDRVREAAADCLRSAAGHIDGLSDFPAATCSRGGSGMCWRRSPTARRTRKLAGGSASARAPSKFIARGS